MSLLLDTDRSQRETYHDQREEKQDKPEFESLSYWLNPSAPKFKKYSTFPQPFQDEGVGDRVLRMCKLYSGFIWVSYEN